MTVCVLVMAASVFFLCVCVCVCVQVIRETIEEMDGQFSVKMEVRETTNRER